MAPKKKAGGDGNAAADAKDASAAAKDGKSNELSKGEGSAADAKRSGAAPALAQPLAAAAPVAAAAASPTAETNASKQPDDADTDGGEGEGEAEDADEGEGDADAGSVDGGGGEAVDAPAPDGELPRASGPRPAYSVQVADDSMFYGRYPDADPAGKPVVTAGATGRGGCCDLWLETHANGVRSFSMCNGDADPDCSATPGPRCSKSGCLAAWHDNERDTGVFWRFGCAAHAVPSKSAMQKKARKSPKYKAFIVAAGLLSDTHSVGVVGAFTPAFTVSDAERARITALRVVDDGNAAPPAKASPARSGAVVRGSKPIAKPQVHVQPSAERAMVALMERLSVLESALNANPRGGTAAAAFRTEHGNSNQPDAFARAALSAASLPPPNLQAPQRSYTSIAADVKAGSMPATALWNSPHIGGAAVHPVPTVVQSAGANAQLPPVPGTTMGMDPLVALLMQQHAGVNQRPVDHAAREITLMDQRAVAVGQRWFDTVREHAKAHKPRYEPWVFQLYLEMIQHLQRSLADGKTWDDPIVAWLSTHMMALFYVAYGEQHQAKVLLFRGHYVAHVMTDKAAAHVVGPSGTARGSRTKPTAGDDFDDTGSGRRNRTRNRNERARNKQKRDKEERGKSAVGSGGGGGAKASATTASK